jgi:hypothetical protein
LCAFGIDAVEEATTREELLKKNFRVVVERFRCQILLQILLLPNSIASLRRASKLLSIFEIDCRRKRVADAFLADWRLGCVVEMSSTEYWCILVGSFGPGFGTRGLGWKVEPSLIFETDGAGNSFGRRSRPHDLRSLTRRYGGKTEARSLALGGSLLLSALTASQILEIQVQLVQQSTAMLVDAILLQTIRTSSYKANIIIFVKRIFFSGSASTTDGTSEQWYIRGCHFHAG